MGVADGHEAIVARIVDQAVIDVALPNGTDKPLPRYVVQEAGAAQRPVGVNGQTDADCQVAVRVEVAEGTYAQNTKTYISALEAMFPPGLLFSGVKVTRAPDVRPPLPITQGVYSVPVIVTGQVTY